MDRKEKVFAYLTSENYIPLKKEEIAFMLDVPKSDISELEKILDELTDCGKIILGKKGRYFPSDAKGQRMSGILSCHKSGKFGFVKNESGEEVYIKNTDIGNALNGDTVLVQLKNSEHDKKEGSIVRILKRSVETIVGVIYTKKGKHFVFRADNPSYYRDIYINSLSNENIKVGMRVAIDGINMSSDKRLYGKVCKILGSANDISSLIEGILIDNKIKTEFDEETLIQSEQIGDKIVFDDDRLDLRNEKIFTIDSELARDFDDAVGLEILENGNYRLGVHIADVSEYVKQGTALDDEAFQRGTSVYIPGKVYPMLPKKLSNGVCSLNPDEDRLTLSVFMEIDKNAKVLGSEISKSVIRSCRRLTYEGVNELFEKDTAELKEKYADVYDILQNMRSLAKKLREKRFAGGSIDFDFPESQIITNSYGMPTQIIPEERGESNRLIEEFMLAANETVAEYAYWAELPIIYRVHQPPSVDKVLNFQNFMKAFGFSLKGKIDEDNPVKPKAFEQILDKVKNTPLERTVSKTMLRSLMKAQYSAENQGHFGLAAKYYCHFTSPIRRYPDLVVHRTVKAFLDGENLHDKSYIIKAAKQSTDKETAADLCERDCDSMLKAVYMSDFIGCDFSGVVSGVTKFGMFVELENSVEGLIRLEHMTEDYFLLDESTQTLTGEKSGKKYTVGDTVSVMVVKCDPILKSVDFILSDDATHSIISKFSENKKRRRKK